MLEMAYFGNEISVASTFTNETKGYILPYLVRSICLVMRYTSISLAHSNFYNIWKETT